MLYQALRGRNAKPSDLIGRTKLTSDIEVATHSAKDEIAKKFKVCPT
jgi:hypothetical protein